MLVREGDGRLHGGNQGLTPGRAICLWNDLGHRACSLETGRRRQPTLHARAMQEPDELVKLPSGLQVIREEIGGALVAGHLSELEIPSPQAPLQPEAMALEIAAGLSVHTPKPRAATKKCIKT